MGGKTLSRRGKRKGIYDEIKATYDAQADPRYGAARLWIDAIIDPVETRSVLMTALEAASLNPEVARFIRGFCRRDLLHFHSVQKIALAGALLLAGCSQFSPNNLVGSYEHVTGSTKDGLSDSRIIELRQDGTFFRTENGKVAFSKWHIDTSSHITARQLTVRRY